LNEAQENLNISDVIVRLKELRRLDLTTREDDSYIDKEYCIDGQYIESSDVDKLIRLLEEQNAL